jgi:hypothetical protein
VFAAVTDPVGLAFSLRNFSFGRKRLELLNEIARGTRPAGVLIDPENRGSPSHETIQSAIMDRNITLACHPAPAQNLARCTGQGGGRRYEKASLHFDDIAIHAGNGTASRCELAVAYYYESGRRYLPDRHMQPAWGPSGPAHKGLSA